MLPKDDLIEFDGRVADALGGGQYQIDIDSDTGTTTVRARLSGKMKKNHIRVLPGDAVRVAVSPYDMSHGLITRRGLGGRRK